MTAGNLPKGKVPKLERWDKYLLLMLPSDDGSFFVALFVEKIYKE